MSAGTTKTHHGSVRQSRYSVGFQNCVPMTPDESGLATACSSNSPMIIRSISGWRQSDHAHHSQPPQTTR